MDQQNILIVGGMACGPKTAARARRRSKDANIVMVEQGGTVSEGTCGLPYYVGGRVENEKALLIRTPQFFREKSNIDVRNGFRATAIDRNSRTVEVRELATGRTSSLPYDKLVLATGARPVVPTSLPGKDLEGVFTLSKIADANRILAALASPDAKKVVVVGAGLIGVESVENFVDRGLDVSVVEALDHVLPGVLDTEMAESVQQKLVDKGVHLFAGQRVMRLEGDDKGHVRQVVTEKETLDADIVLLALGYRPNAELARDAGLDIGPTGAIAVNEFLQTSDPDIYAGGDCVENVHRVTGKKVFAPMGSTANKHGRIIGTNVTGGHDTFPGVIGTAITKVFELTVARLGANEQDARDVGFDPVAVTIAGQDRPGYYPGATALTVKLMADASNGRLLGAQFVGPGVVDKRVDVLVTAITAGNTIEDLSHLDLAYAPPYNEAMDILHDAANVLEGKLKKE